MRHTHASRRGGRAGGGKGGTAHGDGEEESRRARTRERGEEKSESESKRECLCQAAIERLKRAGRTEEPLPSWQSWRMPRRCLGEAGVGKVLNTAPASLSNAAPRVRAAECAVGGAGGEER